MAELNRALRLWNIEKSQRKLWMKRWITLRKQFTTNDFPSDGLVALYDDIAYGESLGTTAKFSKERHGI